MIAWFAPPSAVCLSAYWKYIILLTLAVAGGGCGAESPVSPEPQSTSNATESASNAEPLPDSGVPRLALQEAIKRSAKYLVAVCDQQGQFIYRIHLDPDVELEPQYNVLRHAGAVYALAQYCQRTEDPQAKAALLRSAKFLRDKCVATAADNPNFLAVWSDPILVGGDQPRQAKLGGTGLGLAALLSVEQVESNFTPIDELRKLGRFLVFMQKSDGSFHSKFYPDTGRNDLWQSMYYPGEAALGLLLLYEADPSAQWLHTATKALESLALRGAQQDPTLPDQWYLLSLERWFSCARDRYDAAAQNRLLEHARHLCRDMVREQQKQLDVALLEGCFTPEGRTCPSATRLEGLLAALQYLPPDDAGFRSSVQNAVELGVPFLLRSQVVSGQYAGALPRFAPGFTPARLSDAEKVRMQEVRIDYVQHALSAMIACEREFFAQPASATVQPPRSGED